MSGQLRIDVDQDPAFALAAGAAPAPGGAQSGRRCRDRLRRARPGGAVHGAGEAHPLGGSIQLDDAYLGGERSGGKRGRGAPGKTPFVAAVETNKQGHPLRMKLTVVEGFRLTEIAAWAQLHLGTGTRVVSDGLACFHGVTAAGCVHEPVVVGSGKAAVERPEFRWVNTILGNLKNALRGTYHAIRPKYAQRYLSEFEYRFNRRFDLPDIIPRLVYVALRTPPMPERLLKLRLA